MTAPDMTERQTIPRMLVLIYLIFLGLHWIPVLTESSKLWGLDQWYYFSKPTVLVLTAIGILPLFRFSRATLVTIVSRISSSRIIKRIKSDALVEHLLLLASAAALFWIFRQSTHFLGDGYLWASRMGTGTLFTFMRPLSSSLYQIAYVLTNALGLSQSITAYVAAALMSIVSGLIFLVFAYKTVRALTNQPTEQIFLLLAVLSSGTITLFFGYVEAYPPAAAGVMAFVYFGVRYVQRRENAYFVIVIFLLNVSLHLSLIALLPSLMVILTVKGDAARIRRKYYLIFSAMMVLGLAMLWISQEQKLLPGFTRDTFLRLIHESPNTRRAYPIISFRHLFDFLNEILLISPIVLISIVSIFHSPQEKDRFNGTTLLFLQSIALFYIVEYLVFNKVLGAGRDWDIFSPAGIVLSLYAAILLLERFSNMRRELAVFAFMLLALHNGPWIGINSSEEKSLNRFVNLAGTGYWSNYARAYAYELLGKHSYNSNNKSKAMDYFLAALKADPKNIRYKSELAQLSVENKQYPEALKYYQEILEQKPGSVETMNAIGLLYSTVGQYDSAEKVFLDAMKSAPAYVPTYVNLARLYVQTNRTERAIPVLEKLIEVAPDNAELYRNVGKLYEKIGEASKAGVYFEKAAALEKGTKK